MTEKRFTVKDDVGMLDVACTNIFDDGEFIGTVPLFDAEKFVDLLNEQYETIQRLKQNIDELLSVNVEEELLKENEQLKYNYNEKCNEYCGLEEQVDILLKENEQLKSSDTITDLETQIMKLKQENEQLKSRCNDYDKALKTLQGLTDRKLKENEQLKHSIKCLEADKMELQQYIKRMQGDVE